MRVQCGLFFVSVSVLVLIVVLRQGAAAVPNLRGVAPGDEKYYQSAVIRCRDGSKTFPQERLNDDFCDCVDGTDEPGTNACPEAKFYCKNSGHRPLKVFSSRVNDGICDCCDGSDEYDGKVTCANTCRESGKESNEKLKKKLSTFKEGSIIRRRDVGNAQKQRQEHEQELTRLKGEEKTVKDSVAKLKVEKEAVEKAEKEERERREKEEKAQKEQQERREKENVAAVEEKPQQQAEEEPSTPVEVLPAESPTEEDSTPHEDPKTPNLDHLSDAEKGRIIASRWTGEDVSDIISRESEDDHHDNNDEDDHDDVSDEDVPLLDEHDDDDDEEYSEPHVPHPDETLTTCPLNERLDTAVTSLGPESTDISESTPWWSRLLVAPKYLLQLLHLNRPPVDKSEADRIKAQYEDASDKLRGIQDKIRDLESRTKQDFGKEGEFYAFYDRCFELTEKKYVYKVCAFKDATQVEGHSTTRLGRWQGFKEDYREMIFDRGDRCWNGPERSLRVKMRCGTKLELRAVDEPSRCEYVAEFSTPALCLESKVQALEQQIAVQDPEMFSAHEEL